MKTWWLSYAQEGERGRVMLVDAENDLVARLKAHAMGFYREGDESLAFEIPPGEPEHQLPRNRELTEAELRGVGAKLLGEGE